MKSSLLALILFFCSLTTALPQSGWVVQTSGSMSYTNVFFLNPSTGWASGTNVISKTTNGGLSWFMQPCLLSLFGTRDIFFINDQTGWTVSNGVLLRTSNGGAKWDSIYAYSSVPNSFLFSNENTGWTASNNGKVFKTTNSGYNWFDVAVGTTYSLHTINFTDNNTGYIGAQWGSVLKTTNSGGTWTEQITGTIGNVICSKFVNNNTGWMGCTGGKIVKTTNGGANWSVQSSGRTDNICKIYFSSENNGYAVNVTGTIVKTTNGGTNWSVNANFNHPFLSSHIVNENNIYAAADSGTVWHTTNLGTTWNELYRLCTTKEELKALDFINTLTGWAAGLNGAIINTTNGGLKWNNKPRFTIKNIYDIKFTSGLIGYAGAGGILTGDSSFIYKTLDGGSSWSLSYKALNSAVKRFSFINSNTGWALVSYNTVLKTTNSGSNWISYLISDSIVNTRGISFVNENTGFIAGTYLYKSTNGGVNWNKALDSANIYSVYFINESTGWASRFNLLFKTTNTGISWSMSNISPASIYSGLYFSSPDRGWGFFTNKIYSTSNGGTNWESQVTPAGYSNNHEGRFSFPTENEGWMIYNSTIYHTTRYGVNVHNTGTGIPERYYLHQNYPNPFNPSTKIRFDIPAASQVYLKLYDITGKEVASLINNRLNAGSYEAEWNAGTIASGVYFYKLETDGLIEVKKMVLMK